MTGIWGGDIFKCIFMTETVCVFLSPSFHWNLLLHYSDVIMSAMASQITSSTIVYSDQRTSLCGGIHRCPMNSPHKGPGTQKMFPFDDVIMEGTIENTSALVQVTPWCLTGDMPLSKPTLTKMVDAIWRYCCGYIVLVLSWWHHNIVHGNVCIGFLANCEGNHITMDQ